MNALSLPELALRYLEFARVEKKLAARTVALYSEDLRKLHDFAQKAKLDVLAVDSQHIRRWVAQMHSKGRSPRGIALILSGWRSFYAWLAREKRIEVNPIIDVRAPKATKPLPKALHLDQALQLMRFESKAPAHEIERALQARDAALTELLYGSGLRVAELVNLNLQHCAQGTLDQKGYLDLEAAEVHVIGKGSKSRSLPLTRQCVAALRECLAYRAVLLEMCKPAKQAFWQERDATRHLAVFLSEKGTRMTPHMVWQRLRQRSLDAGLSQAVHPHMLRHSFASHLLQSSQELRPVQELLGHKNISTTQVYTRLDFAHLAKAYDAAHPRAKR